MTEAQLMQWVHTAVHDSKSTLAHSPAHPTHMAARPTTWGPFIIIAILGRKLQH